MPIAPKKSPVTLKALAVGRGSAGGRPATMKKKTWLVTSSKGWPWAAPTASTPGTAARRSTARAAKAACWAPAGYLFCGSERVSARRPRGSNPGETRCIAAKLRMSRPPPASSTRAMAISATTSAERRRRCPAGSLAPRPPLLSTSLRSRREARNAGTRPKPIPVARASATAKPTARASTATSVARGSVSGASARSARRPTFASSTPRSAPAAASRTLSVSSCAHEPARGRAQRRADGKLAARAPWRGRAAGWPRWRRR